MCKSGGTRGRPPEDYSIFFTSATPPMISLMVTKSPFSMALLLSALRNLGWKGVFVFQAADDIFLKQAEKLAAGVIGPQNWAYTKNDDRSKKFVAAFKAKFGKNPSPHSVIYYDGVYIIKDAIEHVGVDKQKIRDYIAGIKNFVGVEGRYHPADLQRGDMSTAVVIIKYDDNLVPQVIKEFQ